MIAIFGSGLAGLSAGRELVRKGRKDFQIFEKDAQIGGLCKSWNCGDYIFDLGPHLIYSKNEAIIGLIKRSLKGSLSKIERRNFIHIYERLIEYPFEFFLHGLPASCIQDCLDGILALDKIKSKEKPKNFLDWAYLTFGKGICDHYFIPYNEKVWKYPLDKMAIDWISGRVPQPNYKDVLKGSMRPQKKKFGPNAYFWYPRKGGIGSLPLSFSKSLDANVHLNSEVVEIKNRKGSLDVSIKSKKGSHSEKFTKIISTIPLPDLISIIDDVPTEVQKAAKELVYNRLLCMGIGVDRPKISDLHSVYFPEKKIVFNRISYPMNLSRTVTPSGKSSILVEVTVNKSKTIDPERMKHQIISDLNEVDILRKDDIIECSDFRTYSPAYVVYDLKHKKNVHTIHEFLEENQVIPAGRFGEWEYLNMDHSIISGINAAIKLMSRKAN